MQQNLNKLSSWEDVDKELSIEITMFEKEFGIEVDGYYPLMRFQRMFDDWIILQQREKKQIERSQRKGRRR